MEKSAFFDRWCSNQQAAIVVGMVVAYNYQPRHNGTNIPLNSYFNNDQDKGQWLKCLGVLVNKNLKYPKFLVTAEFVLSATVVANMLIGLI